MPGSSNFPTEIDTAATLAEDKTNTTPQVNDHPPQHNNLSRAIIAVEQRVGKSGSTDPTSHEYRLLNHSHSAATTAFTPTGGLVSTNVQAAILEVAGLIGGASFGHPDLASHELLGLASEADLANHSDDTSNVHGIVNTAVLETLTGSQTKANLARDQANTYADATFLPITQRFHTILGAYHSDVDHFATPNAGDVLTWDGSVWLPGAVSSGGSFNAVDIAIADVGANFTANNVEAALAEEADARQAHIADPTAHGLGSSLKRVEASGRVRLDDSDYAVAPPDGTFGFVRDTATGRDFISWRSEGIWVAVQGT